MKPSVALVALVRQVSDMLKPIYLKGKIYENYLVDEYGHIFSKKSNRYLHPTLNRDKYLTCRLFYEKKPISTSVALIVAYTFLGDPPKDMIEPTVDHIDGNRTNNNYLNLRWLPKKENVSNRIYKANSGGKGENNVKAKLSEQQVNEICKLLSDLNLSYTKIAELTNSTKHQVSNIASGLTWKYISKNYNFPKRSIVKIKNKGGYRQ